MKNLISINDLNKAQILEILNSTKSIDKTEVLRGKILASLFFESSTRTRLSFESAMIRLGGNVIGFSDVQNSSVKKGENLKDTIRMVQNYADCIVIRHPREGSAKEAARVSRIPVINAGDGCNEHPTQTLIDLYTIREELGGLNNLNIGFIGDLKFGRTVHSLTNALTHFDNKVHLISHKDLGMSEDELDYLKSKGLRFEIHRQLDTIIQHLDILYVTRIQEERFKSNKEYQKYKGSYTINKKLISGGKNTLIIMHPLPRIDEISEDVDDLPNAAYFRQAANGIKVRKAILSKLIL